VGLTVTHSKVKGRPPIDTSKSGWSPLIEKVAPASIRSSEMKISYWRASNSVA
jgi:hypothetical protein